MGVTSRKFEAVIVTRRSKSWDHNKEKNQVDNPLDMSVDYTQGSSGPDKALSRDSLEGITINEDVWEEMITVGKLLCLREEDPDVYDLFNWMRINLYGGQHYGDGLLARVDSEITKELGPWIAK